MHRSVPWEVGRGGGLPTPWNWDDLRSSVMPRREFTQEDSLKGTARAVIARRKAQAERMRKAEIVHRAVTEYDDIAPAALATALALIERVEAEIAVIPVDDALALQRIAQSAEIVHRISRLASGQSTSNVAHAQLSSEERAQRMAELDAMRQAPPSPTE